MRKNKLVDALRLSTLHIVLDAKERTLSPLFALQQQGHPKDINVQDDSSMPRTTATTGIGLFMRRNGWKDSEE